MFITKLIAIVLVCDLLKNKRKYFRKKLFIMKLRGVMIETVAIQHFSKILAAVGKLAKTAALRITHTHFYFILNDQVAGGQSSMWCEVPQTHFFSEFDMEGVSSEQNEIFLELTVDYLLTAFRSALSAKSVKLKLTKKHTPCLTLEVELPSMMSRSRSVVHDIPVSVIPRKFWNEFHEPVMPPFDISVCMPALKMVRNVVDRMKNIDTHLTIAANSDGELILKVETDCVVVNTYFKHLELTNHVANDEHSRSAEARIDIRKVSQFLFGQQINPHKVICNIVNHKMIQFFLLHDDVTLQYLLPCIAA